MLSFPDDNAHCEGKNCDKRDSCLRYLALQQKRKDPSYNTMYLYMFAPESTQDCKYYWKVD